MAITTIYRGIEYRSRLEARWAAFFTGIGWEYTYEPFDGDGYIPDFLIHGKAPLLIEVKPAVTEDDYGAPVSKLERGLSHHWHRDILIVGTNPVSQLPPWFADGRPVAGLLGEPVMSWTGGDSEPQVSDYCWQPGEWITCLNCSSVAIFHPEMSFTSRPCGCYEGDHYLGYVGNKVTDAWAMACNEVKWKARAA